MRCRSPDCVSEPAIARHPAALWPIVVIVPTLETTVVGARRDKVDGCLAPFCGPANINVYWYVCVMHNYLYSLVVCINMLVVQEWYQV
jgi:hypothetical protein